MKFYCFRQNNSFGRFQTFPDKGIGPEVWIEAKSTDHANERAEKIGLYFDGVSNGIDCACCGDRWYRADEYDAKDEVEVVDFWYDWHEVYVHRIDGNIERIGILKPLK